MAKLEDIEFRAIAIHMRQLSDILRAAEGRIDIPDETLQWMNIARHEILSCAACIGMLLPTPNS